MAKVVYIEWKYGPETEIIGVFEDTNKAYDIREQKEYEFKEEGYDDDEVRVWIEDIDIVRDEFLFKDDINLALKLLANANVVSVLDLEKITKILKKFEK